MLTLTEPIVIGPNNRVFFVSGIQKGFYSVFEYLENGVFRRVRARKRDDEFHFPGNGRFTEKAEVIEKMLEWASKNNLEVIHPSTQKER